MVFISYSREDYDSAIKIKNLLKENGIECWMDQSSISAGDNYLKEIPNAIKGSSVFLLVLSHNAQESKWVLLELDEALNRDIVIIPFKIDDEKLNDTFAFVLRTAQWIDAVRDSQSAYSELLSKVRQASGFTRSDEVISDLPKKYTYFQMFGINDISQISIEKLRSQTDITVSMSVPIGINTNHELVHLDLHQRGDGPNGLIVGPPGSGKSDFLNTLSLSLCLFFSPEDVRIHFIDLSGGNNFKNLMTLPHVGTCLREDSREAVDRFLEELETEIKRRLQLLKNYSAANIYQYLKLRKTAATVMEEMPHMIIAIDEIGNLKREYPDAYVRIREWGNQENAAKTGVHLLLTTQNPGGVVDVTTWDTIDFKICSSMQKGEFGEEQNLSVSQCPGRLYMQSQSRSRVQLLQLAYCPEVIEDSVAANQRWFFSRVSEEEDIIHLIARYQLD